MIKRAVQYFPKWSDIRKRYNKSLGGQLITTFVDEVSDIETEIQNYINSYFLQSYRLKFISKIIFIFNHFWLTNFGWRGNIQVQSMCESYYLHTSFFLFFYSYAWLT